MINYLAKFSSKLSELMEPIRELSKDKVPFKCGPKHQAALIHVQKKIASAPVLAYYRSRKQTTLQTDTSIGGLVACLFQDSKPVYFASKALTGGQKAMLRLSWNLLE